MERPPTSWMLGTRRTFLLAITGAASLVRGLSAAADRGEQGGGLEQFAMGGVDCSDKTVATPPVRPDGTFKLGAPRRTSLLEAGSGRGLDNGANGPQLALSGTLAGLKCGPIAGAVIDFWHADASGAYDMAGYRYRGSQLTDDQGRFHLTTIVPGAPGGRARHVSVRVVLPRENRAAGAPTVALWTEIFFPDDPKSAGDPRYRPELTMTRRAAGATFDIRLDR